MAKNRILKITITAISTPQIAISRCMEGLSTGMFHSDLELCLFYIDQYKNSVPSVFIDALFAAEDHRNQYHRGIDPIGMLRALWVRAIYGNVQGASTIEQQFVRTVTRRYERTIARKVREQLLAIALVRHREKKSIASAYLSIAFYGSGCVGLKGLKAKFGPQLDGVDKLEALRFVSQLKYPRPLQPSLLWHRKIDARTEMIWKANTKD